MIEKTKPEIKGFRIRMETPSGYVTIIRIKDQSLDNQADGFKSVSDSETRRTSRIRIRHRQSLPQADGAGI